MARSEQAWPGRLFLSLGRALYVGAAFDTGLHAHHAIQVCIGISGTFRLRASSGSAWLRSRAALVPANQPHQMAAGGELLALAYIEPEGRDGKKLVVAEQPGGIIALPSGVAAEVAKGLERAGKEIGPAGAEELYLQLFRALGFEESAGRPLDGRIASSLEILRELTGELPSSLELAKSVGLSPTRFRHLFAAELGLSYRRYLLWRKLNAAAQELAAGGSLTGAACAAGFSDSSHLTRTFQRMFGIAPSLVPREMWSFPTQ